MSNPRSILRWFWYHDTYISLCTLLLFKKKVVTLNSCCNRYFIVKFLLQEFVDWLVATLFRNLYLGASFPCRTTALSSLLTFTAILPEGAFSDIVEETNYYQNNYVDMRYLIKSVRFSRNVVFRGWRSILKKLNLSKSHQILKKYRYSAFRKILIFLRLITCFSQRRSIGCVGKSQLWMNFTINYSMWAMSGFHCWRCCFVYCMLTAIWTFVCRKLWVFLVPLHDGGKGTNSTRVSEWLVWTK